MALVLFHLDVDETLLRTSRLKQPLFSRVATFLRLTSEEVTEHYEEARRQNAGRVDMHAVFFRWFSHHHNPELTQKDPEQLFQLMIPEWFADIHHEYGESLLIDGVVAFAAAIPTNRVYALTQEASVPYQHMKCNEFLPWQFLPENREIVSQKTPEIYADSLVRWRGRHEPGSIVLVVNDRVDELIAVRNELQRRDEDMSGFSFVFIAEGRYGAVPENRLLAQSQEFAIAENFYDVLSHSRAIEGRGISSEGSPRGKERL